MRILQGSPYSSARSIVAATGLALNTVVSTLEQFRAMGLVVEVTGRERGKIYRYREYLRLLDEGTELL